MAKFNAATYFKGLEEQLGKDGYDASFQIKKQNGQGMIVRVKLCGTEEICGKEFHTVIESGMTEQQIKAQLYHEMHIPTTPAGIRVKKLGNQLVAC